MGIFAASMNAVRAAAVTTVTMFFVAILALGLSSHAAPTSVNADGFGWGIAPSAPPQP
jgi:hypothetical protein